MIVLSNPAVSKYGYVEEKQRSRITNVKLVTQILTESDSVVCLTFAFFLSLLPRGLLCPLDLDGNGYITASELGNLFNEVRRPLPGYQIRELLQKLDRDNDSRISLEEFTAVGNTN